MPSVQISDETLDRLKSVAEPFVDKEPEDVIRRLLDDHALTSADHGRRARRKATSLVVERRLMRRTPRERGIIVELDGHRLQAVSVRDLYQQALAFLVEHHEAHLKAAGPFKTSNRRYLLANEPIHPSGNRFVIPVEYRGYYLEAHKDYKNGISHLRSLLRRLNLTLKIFS